MSENNNFPIYPKLDNEIITVTGFLNLKSVKMETGTITVLIGEQAAGKSILAKLQYFFWKYQSDLFDTETLSKKTMAGYSKNKVGEFFKLFSVTSKNSEPFKIEYKSNDIKICIERTKDGHKPRITTSLFLENAYAKAKKGYMKYSKSDPWRYQINEKEPEKELENHEKRMDAHRILRENFHEFMCSTPGVLYVPASRSFFSTIEDNVFAFLAKGKESLDPLIVQFGEFYESAKRRKQNSSKHEIEKDDRRGDLIINDILKGDFLQENDKDIIRTAWGDVELRHASSGQQEALPLILSLLYFAYPHNTNQLIIIEEPEAHLFPIAQKKILEAIVKATQSKNCSVLIATHSPYVPTCINNEIQIALNKEKPLDVKAYYISKGKAKNIYLKEDDMIDTDQIDSVSEELMSEYYHALKKYDELNDSKGKTRE